MALVRRRNGENRIQVRLCIYRSSRVRFSFPALLSVSPSVGASRSGKHFTGDYLGSLPLDIRVRRRRVARHRLQIERAATSYPNLPLSVLVRCRVHRRHDCPLGMVAALTVACRHNLFPAGPLVRTLLTLYAGAGSSLGVKGGEYGSQTR